MQELRPATQPEAIGSPACRGGGASSHRSVCTTYTKPQRQPRLEDTQKCSRSKSGCCARPAGRRRGLAWRSSRAAAAAAGKKKGKKKQLLSDTAGSQQRSIAAMTKNKSQKMNLIHKGTDPGRHTAPVWSHLAPQKANFPSTPRCATSKFVLFFPLSIPLINNYVQP